MWQGHLGQVKVTEHLIDLVLDLNRSFPNRTELVRKPEKLSRAA